MVHARDAAENDPASPARQARASIDWAPKPPAPAVPDPPHPPQQQGRPSGQEANHNSAASSLTPRPRCCRGTGVQCPITRGASGSTTDTWCSGLQPPTYCNTPMHRCVVPSDRQLAPKTPNESQHHESTRKDRCGRPLPDLSHLGGSQGLIRPQSARETRSADDQDTGLRQFLSPVRLGVTRRTGRGAGDCAYSI